jgi:hypothetical protein
MKPDWLRSRSGSTVQFPGSPRANGVLAYVQLFVFPRGQLTLTPSGGMQ